MVKFLCRKKYIAVSVHTDCGTSLKHIVYRMRQIKSICAFFAHFAPSYKALNSIVSFFLTLT